MRHVERTEILPLGEYEAIRPHFRARIIAEKKVRRIALGPSASAVFENHDTVLLQIQEMLRTERITREDAILHEIETYNELLPTAVGLSCTIMIEVDDKETRERLLLALKGIEKAVLLTIGGETFRPLWSPGRELPDRASAVLYLQFPLSETAATAIRSGAGVSLGIDHEAYLARADLSPATVKSLALDLE